MGNRPGFTMMHGYRVDIREDRFTEECARAAKGINYGSDDPRDYVETELLEEFTFPSGVGYAQAYNPSETGEVVVGVALANKYESWSGVWDIRELTEHEASTVREWGAKYDLGEPSTLLVTTFG